MSILSHVSWYVFRMCLRIVGDPGEGKSLNGREKNSGEDNFFSLPFKFRVEIFPASINFPWVSENGV